VLSPIAEAGVYGVTMDVKSLINVPVPGILTPFVLFLIIIGSLAYFKIQFKFETRFLLRSILLGISLSYVFVFLYSIYYQGVLTQFSSPNIVLLIFLMGFFIFSAIYLPYLSIIEIRSLRLNFTAEILFLLLLAILFSYLPTIYTTLSFVMYCILFVLRKISSERILFLLYVILLMFNYYLIAIALLFFAYGIFSDFRRLKLSYTRVYILIPIFISLSLLVGEVIPFEISIKGIAYLIVLSGSEEVIFKRFLFDNMNERIGRIAVPVAFCVIHILNLNVFNYYLGKIMLPLFLAYIFSYQYVTVRMYEKHRNLIPFMIVHTCINLISLVAGSFL